jgi:hypothetical protein
MPTAETSSAGVSYAQIEAGSTRLIDPSGHGQAPDQTGGESFGSHHRGPLRVICSPTAVLTPRPRRDAERSLSLQRLSPGGELNS